MKRMYPIIDSLESGLIMILLVPWGLALALMYVYEAFHRWTMKIARLSRQTRNTYSDSFVVPFEPTLLKIQSEH